MLADLRPDVAEFVPRAPAADEEPVRRFPAGESLGRCLELVLDQIDYGLLLVAANGRVLHANRAARNVFATPHPLINKGGLLAARDPADMAAIRKALEAAAQRGLRGLVPLGDGSACSSVAFVPLGDFGGGDATAVLVVIGRRSLCESLSAQWYARCHGLPRPETQILDRLCVGAAAQEIARLQGVAISTIRSQIGSIRAKTGAASIRDLVNQVSVMPPLVGVLGRQPASAPFTLAS